MEMDSSLKRVVIESPFRGESWKETARNIYYLRLCVRDSIGRGEAPFASHMFYTQTGVLNDTVPEDRRRGSMAGLAWAEVASASIFYIDFGMSDGMKKYGLIDAQKKGREIIYRNLQECGIDVNVEIKRLASMEQFIKTGVLF